jgi:hypothetical protein
MAFTTTTTVSRSRSNAGILLSIAIGLSAGVLLGIGILRWFSADALARDFACSHLTAIAATRNCDDLLADRSAWTSAVPSPLARLIARI